jgi:hypothetical protein
VVQEWRPWTSPRFTNHSTNISRSLLASESSTARSSIPQRNIAAQRRHARERRGHGEPCLDASARRRERIWRPCGGIYDLMESGVQNFGKVVSHSFSNPLAGSNFRVRAAFAFARSGQTREASSPRLHARLAECCLEMHPSKTKILYCKDGKRLGKTRLSSTLATRYDRHVYLTGAE